MSKVNSPILRKGVKSDVLTPEGNLTTAEKKRILLNNIYGVDIDVNAVEVTKLSLLLKCMEGGRALAQVKPTVLTEMPIRFIDEKNNSDKSLQEGIISNVDTLLRLYPEISESRLQTKTEHLVKRVEYHISKIDEIVYQLYDLTEEEIAIIEGNSPTL